MDIITVNLNAMQRLERSEVASCSPECNAAAQLKFWTLTRATMLPATAPVPAQLKHSTSKSP